MILFFFYEMKLLAFIGDFFTPMLPSYCSFILTTLFSAPLSCSTVLLFFSLFTLSCILCSSVLLSLCCPYPVGFIIPLCI
ncbi:hypothetical protein PPACK8108_LOCUS26261, partial [Phakopsora pachyrhizi]